LPRETALCACVLPFVPSLVGLLRLLLDCPLVGENQNLILAIKLVEPSRMVAILQAQMDGGEVAATPWAQEFFASSATSISRGARLTLLSLRASRPAFTISDADAPSPRRCS